MIAVILAGGAGTRFWPLSQPLRPKQLIRLWGDRVMIGQTVERLAPIIPPERVLVVCGPHLLAPMRQALPELEASSFVVEPEPRNTAPAIALAAAHVRQRFGPDEVIGVFPSDHYIGDEAAFRRTVERAASRAREGAIVTIGVAPTRPETGYGYIRRGEPLEQEEGAWRVAAFEEKPDAARALEYVRAGEHDWNAGMFFFTPEVLLSELERQMPETAAAIAQIEQAVGTPSLDRVTAEAFGRTEATSIDYGVMEGARRVEVVRASFPWSDVGHWAALPEVRPTDEDGNVVEADALLHQVRDSILYSTTDRVVAAASVEGLVIVDTPEALLVIPRERAQQVRQLVDLWRERRSADLASSEQE